MGTPPQVFTTSEVMQLPIQANLPHATNSPIGHSEAAKKNPSKMLPTTETFKFISNSSNSVFQ